jgi:hypothetical protein
MKLSDLIQLEHERETGLEPRPLRDLEAWLKDSTQLRHTVGGEESGSLALFRYEIDSSNHIIILTPIEEQDKPVGYVSLQKENRWKVLDLWLNARLRGKGIITNLYRVLTADGYKLQSGDALSTSAEKVWLRLGELGIAKVLDTQTGKVEDFSIKPMGDGSIINGVKPRFYWITEGQKLLTVFHRGTGLPTTQQLDAWLTGGVHAGRDTYGMGTFVVEATE